MAEESFADTLWTQILQLMRDMDTPAYLVGGTVRDEMLKNRPVTLADAPGSCDLDFAVPVDGLRLARRIADALGGAFYALDADRGVGRAVFTDEHGQTRILDVARFQGPDLIADLAGRDFTINAMALDISCDPPRLIDPYGGQADLQARQVRAVSMQSISRDPVRGLRAVRLAAQLGFEIEPHTQRLIQDSAPGLAGVSAERVRDELGKILSLPSTAAWLRQLDDLNLLAQVLPEVTALKGLAQTGRHRWDAYEHTLQAVASLETLLPLASAPLHSDIPFSGHVTEHLARLVTGGHSRRLLLTLATLLHDVGKPHTVTLEPDRRARFIGHDSLGATMAANIIRRLRFSSEAVRLVETVVRHHLRPLQLTWRGKPSKRATHRFFRDAGDAGIEVALLSLADNRATTGYDDQADPCSEAAHEYRALIETVTSLLDAYFNRQHSLVSPPPLLTGRDLIDKFGLQQGPDIGRLLTALQEAQATGQVMDRAQAEEWVRHAVRDRKLEISPPRLQGQRG
ncbi:MAG: HD domain-containing protein [Anaerolineae bacterium]